MTLWLPVILTLCLGYAQSENCKTPHGELGQCRRIRDCGILWDLALKTKLTHKEVYNLRKAACGFEQTMPKVWCPDVRDVAVDECKLTAAPPDPRSRCCGIASSDSNKIIATAIAEDTSSSSKESRETGGVTLAKPCDEEACQLPNCRCSSTNIPGGLAALDTPQFVMVTFDDGININNIHTYRNTIYNRVNSNGCSAGTTFFVNHEYTDYELVNELYNHGFEIALHSISHKSNQAYWSAATYEDMKKEFHDQKLLMSHFANIPIDELKGLRLPSLQMAGNASFQVMADYDIQYDSSWPTVSQINPGLWPYTLDYASTQECVTLPCPTASIPGTWVLPMLSWSDLSGFRCAMVDTCFFVPRDKDGIDDEEGWFRFIVGNFERHYLGNRAPFGFYIHEWYINTRPAVRRAMVRFLDLINNMQDVFMVNSHEVIDWVKDPIPLDEYKKKPCRSFPRTICQASSCGRLWSDHNPWTKHFYMRACNVCPRRYPWLGNPLGLEINKAL